MSDRRIVRGNTYSGNIGNSSGNVHIRRRQLGGKAAGKHKQLLPDAKLSQLGMDPLTTFTKSLPLTSAPGPVSAP